MSADGVVGRRTDAATGAQPSRLPRGQRGSATVLTAGAVAALVVVLAAGLLVVGVVRDVHRARSAADLSALAGAGPLVEGGTADCAGAAAVADVNGARLTGCSADAGTSVRVTVSVALQPVVRRLGWRDAVASARAGVVDDSRRGPTPQGAVPGEPEGALP